MLQLRIGAKISIFVSLLVVISLAFFAGVFIYSSRQKAISDIESEAKSFAEFATHVIYQDYLTLYTHPTEGVFEAFKARIEEKLKLNPDVSSITMVGVNGNVLFDSSELKDGKYQGGTRTVADEAIMRLVKSDETLLEGSYMAVPVPEVSGGHLFTLIYKISNLSLESRMNEVYAQVALTIIPLVIFGITVSIVFAVLIVSPIYELMNASKKIEGGDFDFHIDIKSRDEFAILGTALNTMSAKIKSYYGSLEDKVFQRTSELEETKQKLQNQSEALKNILEDLEEEKKLRESQNESLLATIGEGIVVTDQTGRVMYVNPAFEALTHYTNTMLIGRVFSDIVVTYDLKGKQLPPSQISDAAAVTAKINSTNAREMKVLIENPRNSEDRKAFVINSAPINVEGKFRGVVRIVHDFSEDFKLAQQKDDFFSIASHELRTPLTVISGNLDILLNYGKSKLTVADMALVQDSQQASERLIKMINDFLNVSRLDQGRLKYELVAIDICELTKQVVEELIPLAKEKHITLTYECVMDHIEVIADEGFLREIFTNLIGNSIKFTSKGGISITQQMFGNFLKVFISDTGLGIVEDKQKLLFNRFQQAMSRTISREAGGTGLGLYISREFVKVMGGELILEKSELGKGSVFSFTIPLAKEGGNV